MLSVREEKILKSIVTIYITQAKPVPSQTVTNDCELSVSPATIRSEMAHLEQEGYITRSHSSAGSVPSDKAYRHYVDSLSNISLPIAEQRRISHVFHQVEKELEEWLSLAATLIAQMVQNAAVVTLPKAEACRFKRLDLVSLQEYVTLVVLVLMGAKLRERLATFEQAISQSDLTAMANKLSAVYAGLTRSQILAKEITLSPGEQQITDCMVQIMADEDNKEYEEPYLDGLRLTLSQPELVHSRGMALTLMELIEQRNLLSSIVPAGVTSHRVQVVIGKENKLQSIHEYSVAISRYGPAEEAVGTIGVIGPTRMPYARTIVTLDYLSVVLTRLMTGLYGRKEADEVNQNRAQ
ncbi:MAG: Heat-inducible transcription repressor HrcA [Dehalococcoidales bacterium]|nr:Heat-inducible transcription repressor HrcA [Dehalococcoidales bacterium]